MPNLIFKVKDNNGTVTKTVVGNYEKSHTFEEIQEIIEEVSKYRRIVSKKNLIAMIPKDILINMLIPKLTLNNIVSLICVNRNYFNQKYTIYDTYIQSIRSDSYRFIPYNLTNIIKDSSFTYELFDNIYKNIKYTTRLRGIDFRPLVFIAENTPYQDYHDQGYLNNNFQIFQILKSLSLSNKNCTKEIGVLITYYMHFYMHQLYFKRNNAILDNKLIYDDDLDYDDRDIRDDLIDCFKDEVCSSCNFYNMFGDNWEYSHLNLYNIYENMSCLTQKKTVIDNFDVRYNHCIRQVIINNNFDVENVTLIFIKKHFRAILLRLIMVKTLAKS